MKAPSIPVVHNFDARTRTTPDGVREALVGQADHPVRWSQCIGAIADAGASMVLECGPGKVLGPLSARIREGLRGASLHDRAAIDAALAALAAT